MEFEIRDTFYVSESDFNRMVQLCLRGCSPHYAISIIASGWDDVDFYRVGLIEDQLTEKIEQVMINYLSI